MKNILITFLLTLLMSVCYFHYYIQHVQAHDKYDTSWVMTHSKIEKDRRIEHKRETVNFADGSQTQVLEDDLDLTVDDVTPVSTGRMQLTSE